jgi:hypothetical protein
VLLKGLIIPIFRLSHNDPSIRFGLSINLIYIQALIVVTRRGQQSHLVVTNMHGIYDLLVVTVLLYMIDDFLSISLTSMWFIYTVDHYLLP